jgi:Transcriptional regulator
METEDSGDKQNSAVARTMAVLEALSGHRDINLERLAEQTGLPKATLIRFLGTLISLGYVYRDPNDQYSLTLRMFSVGSRGLEHLDLVSIARPIAEELAEEFGETVHMGILEGDSAIYVLKVESKYNIRMHSRVGKSIPLYCTAIGKTLLSGLTAGEFSKILAGLKMVPFTKNTLKTHMALKTEIAAIQKKHYAIDREEHEAEVTCIAAPVRDHAGAIVAAISASWPLFRYEKKSEPIYVERIQAAAERISGRLGWYEKKND